MNLTSGSVAVAIGIILGGLWVIISIQVKHAQALQRMEQGLQRIELKEEQP